MALHHDPASFSAIAIHALEAAVSIAGLDYVRAQHLGCRSPISSAALSVRALPEGEQRTLSAWLDAEREAIEQAYCRCRGQLLAQTEAVGAAVRAVERIDLAFRGRKPQVKGIHPVSRSLARIEECFLGLGFETAEGAGLETAFCNFASLHLPDDDPATAMAGAVYLDADGGQVRTRTSPIHASRMRRHARLHRHAGEMPEIRIIAPGRGVRVGERTAEAAGQAAGLVAGQAAMFHQLEGLWIGKSISFAHLKSVLQDFLKTFFETGPLETRFRPPFLPFTEPSAEIDLAFTSGLSKGKWLEIGTCGMVHPTVLKMCNIDWEAYAGFCFAIDIDRLTMLRYGVGDLRPFCERDARFLRDVV